jgi:hypothetical protein
MELFLKIRRKNYQLRRRNDCLVDGDNLGEGFWIFILVFLSFIYE